MHRVKLKPAPGLRVLDPKTMKPLPPEGREVELTPLWARRLAQGDVVQVKDSEEARNGDPVQ